MRRNATYIVGVIAAIAVVVVVPPIAFDNGRTAWIVCGIIAFGLAMSIPVYLYARERKVSASINPSAPVIGPLIATHDQSIAFANEATVNYYAAPPANEQPEEESADE